MIDTVLTVETKDHLTKSEFQRFVGPGGAPVLVTDTMGAWNAMHTWTFEWFQSRYGQDQIVVADSINNPQHQITVSLREYLDYILQSDGTALHAAAARAGLTSPFYAYDYQPLITHPELLSDFHLPEFVDDWFTHFSPQFRAAHFPYQQGWILFAACGATSQLHQDDVATITQLAQIRGRKRCVLFAPEDAPYLYEGAVDPLSPDLERFPLYRQATPLECMLESGTVLFLPPNWWHHVVTLEPSITLSYNVINESNFGFYVRDLYQRELPKWLARLPAQPPRRVGIASVTRFMQLLR